MRGMAWYELGSARAEALNAQTVAEWNRAVQADYNRFLMDRAAKIASRKALSQELQAESAKRVAETQRRWRENPTLDDIRAGLALNALAGDLADPAIPATRWRNARVELPPGLSIQSLAFRFTDSPSYRLPVRMRPSTVAIGRIKMNNKWPIAFRRPEFDAERASYERAIKAVIDACVKKQQLQAPPVDALRASVFALKEKASALFSGGSVLAKDAKRFLDQLDESTKIFLDRDFAEELIRDSELHQAKTVGELLAFMKKYRLLFAEADDNPAVWRTYETLYEALKRQKISLDFADPREDAKQVEKPADKPK